MIIWIASYPKSGNTWIRSLLSAYLFSKDGSFNFKMLRNIDQFSSRNLSLDLKGNTNYQSRISKNWVATQKIINKDKKIRIFKTHNALCEINGNKFTDKFNTIAAIYIVRDPRNLITSLAHHYDFSLEEAFSFLTNKRKIIFPKNFNDKEQNEPQDFNFLGDWSGHYQSWKNIKFCPVKIIKYEDILDNTQKIFISTLTFLSKFMQLDINEKKIKKVIDSTSFNKLRKMEMKEGFYESVLSTKANKEIKFFNLGEKNNWKKLLDSKTAEKIGNIFKNEMKELDYLKIK